MTRYLNVNTTGNFMSLSERAVMHGHYNQVTMAEVSVETFFYKL